MPTIAPGKTGQLILTAAWNGDTPKAVELHHVDLGAATPSASSLITTFGPSTAASTKNGGQPPFTLEGGQLRVDKFTLPLQLVGDGNSEVTVAVRTREDQTSTCTTTIQIVY
jgi:hypothetical protein